MIESFAHPVYPVQTQDELELRIYSNWYAIGDQLTYYHLNKIDSLFIVFAPDIIIMVGLILLSLSGILEEIFIFGVSLGAIISIIDVELSEIIRIILEKILEQMCSLLDKYSCLWYTIGTTDLTPMYYPGFVNANLGGYFRIGNHTLYDIFEIGDPNPNYQKPYENYTITLHPGWNLISVPLLLKNSCKFMTEFFPSDIKSNIIDVWSCYNIDQSSIENSLLRWRYYSPTQSCSIVYETLYQTNPYDGCWIYYAGSSDTSFTVSGIKAPVDLYPLYWGWRLQSYPGDTPSNTSIYSGYLDVWSYKNKSWAYYSEQRCSNNSGFSNDYPHLQSVQKGDAVWLYAGTGVDHDINGPIEAPPDVPESHSGIHPPETPIPQNYTHLFQLINQWIIFNCPQGIAIDSQGNLYVSDGACDAIKKIYPNGTFTTIGSGFYDPQGVAVDSLGNVYVADTNNKMVKEIYPDGNIVTLGSGFGRTFDVAVDSHGNVYVADGDNNAVKEIHPNGTVTTICEISQAGFIAVDSYDNIFVTSYDGGSPL